MMWLAISSISFFLTVFLYFQQPFLSIIRYFIFYYINFCIQFRNLISQYFKCFRIAGNIASNSSPLFDSVNIDCDLCSFKSRIVCSLTILSFDAGCIAGFIYYKSFQCFPRSSPEYYSIISLFSFLPAVPPFAKRIWVAQRAFTLVKFTKNVWEFFLFFFQFMDSPYLNHFYIF